MQDELRIEGLGDGRVRIARWMLSPGRGWDMQDAPVMLPPERYAGGAQGGREGGSAGRRVRTGLTATDSMDWTMSAHPCLTRDPSSSALSLTLVTGPANSGRAGVVLGGYRERLAEEPVLVVPYFQDVEHNQRELAEKGAVLGARVMRFAWLFDLVARRAGYSARTVTRLQRELIVEEAVVSRQARRHGRIGTAARLRAFQPAS